MIKIDDHPEVLEDLWHDVDQGKGMVSRDDMFNHLKYARDIEMPTPAVVPATPSIPEVKEEKKEITREGSFKG